MRIRLVVLMLALLTLLGALLIIHPPAQAAPVGTPPCSVKGHGQMLDLDFARYETGWGIFWLCRDPQTRAVRLRTLACVHGTCSETAAAVALAALKLAPNPGEEAKALWERHVTGDCAVEPLATVCRQAMTDGRAMAAKYFELHPEMRPPEPAVWKVAPNWIYTTRPARIVVDGALQTHPSPAPTVAVGTKCDATAQPTFASGSDQWLAVPGQPPALRWLCRKP